MSNFIALYLFSVPALICLMILGVIFSSYECDGWAVFIGICTGIIGYSMFGVTLTNIIIIAIAYFTIGVLWSFWRYKRFVDSAIEYDNKTDKSIVFLQIRIDPKNNVGKISSWIMSWPFSMVENITGDVVRMIRTFISETMKSVYNKIYENAIAKIINPEESK